MFWLRSFGFIVRIASQFSRKTVVLYEIWVAGVWVGAEVDPLVVFVGVVSELSWG